MTAVALTLTRKQEVEEIPRDQVRAALDRIRAGDPIDVDIAHALLGARGAEQGELLTLASAMRDAGAAARGDTTGRAITYSRKVFIPLTTLCRDRCHYCVFVDTPGGLRAQGKQAFLTPEEVLEIARAGAAAGCKEALFTLGDRPEDRWDVAREWLSEHGYASTLDYVAAVAALVLQETGLLPHVNPGVMSWQELQRMRPVSPSMGMMLETTSSKIWSEKGGAHYGSPDKDPAVRLRAIEDAGRSRVPFTTGILLGIGETLRDRAESLFAIRASHERWGHVQEVIVQNFRAKPRTAMQGSPDLATDQYIAAVAVARLVMGPDAHIQVPPNLTDPEELSLLVRAGIDDWGGVSPLTPDHVNPERPWPHIDDLARLTAATGYELRERLTAHPRWVTDANTWIDPGLRVPLAALAGPDGLAREGARPQPPHSTRDTAQRGSAPGASGSRRPVINRSSVIDRATDSPASLSNNEWADLLRLDGEALEDLAAAADEVRANRLGSSLSYVVNANLDASAYDPRPSTSGVDDAAVFALAEAAGSLGATEVCVQGPLNPELPGTAYFDLVDSLKSGNPTLHLHAFRAAEVLDAANRLGITPREVYERLRGHGVGSVPGTAALILNDGIRSALTGGQAMPAAQWAELMRTAHRAGLRSTATMVYGHIETPLDVVRHLRSLAQINSETGGFTEFIAMPLVPAEFALPAETRAVLPGRAGLPGGATRGASTRYTRAIHAVARLFFAGNIDHVQAAWPKIGFADTELVLAGGADDIGGLLLSPPLHFASGATLNPEDGRSLAPSDIARIAQRLGRTPQQRTTLYAPVSHRPEPNEPGRP